MSERRLISVDALIVALSFMAALLLRTAPGWGNVFQTDTVVFQGVDAWFHMRVAENLAHNFPWRLGMDPFGLIPGGQAVNTGPLLDYLIAAAAWVLGLGSPTERLIDTVGALTPAILGAAITIPVYWVARQLFGRTAGRLAAPLVAIFPGVFLSYSLLGVTDHHVSESLLFVISLGIFIHGLRAETSARRLRSAVWLGVALTCVLYNRPGAFFVPALFAVWTVVQLGLDLRHRRTLTAATGLLLPALGIALTAFLPLRRLQWGALALTTLVAAIVAVGGAQLLARFVRSSSWPLLRWLTGLLGGGALLLSAGMVLAPDQLRFVWAYGSGFVSGDTIQTVGELFPLFKLSGTFRWTAGFVQFAFAGLLAIPAIFWLLWQCRDGADASKTLFAVVTLAVMAATLAQNRHAVYLAPCVAIVVGWCAAAMLARGGRKDKLLAGFALAALIYAPNIPLGVNGARLQRGPSLEWRGALSWMRRTTPEPLGRLEAYFSYYPRDLAGSYEHPAGAYGVMNWWDNGYWIQKLARRIPTANGTQAGARAAASFYVSQDPEAAGAMMRDARARYALADHQLPLVRLNQMGGQNARFMAMTVWAEVDLKDYVEVFFQMQPDGSRLPLLVFYPAYYESMLARLYIFQAKAAFPNNSTYVFSYRDQETEIGEPYRTLQSQLRFETYEKAAEYIAARPDQNLTLGGLDPMQTCVPLERLQDFRLAYDSSPAASAARGHGIGGSVRVFEYTGGEGD